MAALLEGRFRFSWAQREFLYERVHVIISVLAISAFVIWRSRDDISYTFCGYMAISTNSKKSVFCCGAAGLK